ncbi:MAG: hypothetical protein JRJ86_24330 [Deltaproteobacteria bacterium]|nr:hypothetical protein [Deltaproteobacteria bacterium]
MTTKDVKRKLRAILSADVQGYSRLMGDDEVATVKTITEYRETLTSLVNQYNGRVVDSPGDKVLSVSKYPQSQERRPSGKPQDGFQDRGEPRRCHPGARPDLR